MGLVILRFLKHSLDMPVMKWSGGERELVEFLNGNVFEEKYQPMMNPAALAMAMQSAGSEDIIEIKDMLGISMLFFRMRDLTYLLGPFTCVPWSDHEGETILAGVGLPIQWLIPYNLKLG